MSKMSDYLVQADKDRQPGNLLKTAAEGKMPTKYPGMEGFKRMNHAEIAQLLRRGKFHYSGATPWSAGEQAIIDTAIYLHGPMCKFLVNCLATGFLIGNSKIMPQFENTDWDQQIDQKDDNLVSYLTDTTEMIMLDEDTVRYLADRLADATHHFAGVMGYFQHTDKETLHIWDVWTASLGACAMSMFINGQEVGEKWQQEQILEGILSASQAEEM